MNRSFSEDGSVTNDSVTTAKYTTSLIVLDGKLNEDCWKLAKAVRIERIIKTGETVPALSTTVRTLWTDDALYIAYEAPYTKLRKFEPAIFEGKRVGLWERDVVEVFINSNPENINRYSEYEVAPTGEKIDLMLDLPNKDFLWDSQFEAAIHLDSEKRLWTTEMRIPFTAFETAPTAGTRWSINYYRHAIEENVFLGWQPTMDGSAHTPSRFGILEFKK